MSACNSSMRKATLACCSILLLGGAACDSWPKVGDIPIDDLLNHACELEGSIDPSTTISRASPPRVVVTAIRGFGDISSLGLNVIVNELNQSGVQARSYGMSEWGAVGDQIAAQHAAARDSAPGVVLMGHSYGADDAIKLATILQQRGVMVNLLLLLDATAPGPIPDNVDRCVHFYCPWPGNPAPDTLPGQPVTPALFNIHTVIVNDALGVEGDRPTEWCITHMGIDMSTYVQTRIMQEIFSLPD